MSAGISSVFKAYDERGVPSTALRDELDGSDRPVQETIDDRLDEDDFEPNNWNDLTQSDGWGSIAVRYGTDGTEYGIDVVEAGAEEIEGFLDETDTVADWQTSEFIPESRRSELTDVVEGLEVSTVCEEAECPNISECWSDEGEGSEATFMVEDSCSRDCSFCAVDTGVEGEAVSSSEVERIVNGIFAMDVDHAVVTSVDRDDLLRDEYSGTYGIAEALRDIAYKVKEGGKSVEVLSPDFRGSEERIDTVLEARPDVFSHNIETVESMQQEFRDSLTGYKQSLEVLRYADEMMQGFDGDHYTKSSIMLGAGEEVSEVKDAIDDLADANVDILTLGQYKQPSEGHWDLREEVPPRRFQFLEDYAYDQGFDAVVSHPDSRSSYRAGEIKDMAESGLEYSMVYDDTGTDLVLRA
jgi:lipoic acid synthetase